jgi:hypothetical protein
MSKRTKKVVEAQLVKFDSEYDGEVDAYESTTLPGTYFYLSEVGTDTWSAIIETLDGATEAIDDWLVGRESAMIICKELAEGTRGLEF